MEREVYVVIERDEDGFFVGEAPQLRSCHAQGHALDEPLKNIREVIELCLEEEPQPGKLPEFVAVQRVTV